jgi:hypothetical protein
MFSCARVCPNIKKPTPNPINQNHTIKQKPKALSWVVNGGALAPVNYGAAVDAAAWLVERAAVDCPALKVRLRARVCVGRFPPWLRFFFVLEGAGRKFWN